MIKEYKNQTIWFLYSYFICPVSKKINNDIIEKTIIENQYNFDGLYVTSVINPLNVSV